MHRRTTFPVYLQRGYRVTAVRYLIATRGAR